MNLHDHIDHALGSLEAKRPYLVVDGHVTTYGAMADRIARLYSLFEALGLQQGDRIGIVSRDVPTIAGLMLAGFRFGLAVVNLNPDMPAPEKLTALEATDVHHLFVDGEFVDLAPLPSSIEHTRIDAQANRKAGGLIGKLLSGSKNGSAGNDLHSVLETAQPGSPPATISPETTSLMLLTSGTTSTPKVVELSAASVAAQISTFLKVYDYDRASRILNPLPLHFTDGIMHGPVIAFMTGGTLYRPSSFRFQKLDELLLSIYRDRITHFIAVPALLSLLNRLGAAFENAFDTPDFRYLRSSGDLLPEALWRAVQDRFNIRVINTYGLSETVCEAIYCGPDAERFKIGTIGKPVDCEIRIVDDEGDDVGDGEIGELLIRGSNIMKGYLNQPELTEQAFCDDWFRTGDYAQADRDGFLRITGRKKTLIISGGVNIHPQEITDALLTHEDVVDAITFGIPHPFWGEEVACAIVLHEGRRQASAEHLIEHCRRLLAPHKVPKRVTLVDELPRNPAGKIVLERVRAITDAPSIASPDNPDIKLEDAIIDVAGRVFSCPPDSLRLDSQPGTVPGWDSFAHLTLVSEVESVFDVDLTPADILKIECLGDLANAVTRLRAKARVDSA